MTVAVAEYLGRRTDTIEAIQPIHGRGSYPCPFSYNNNCKKATRGSHPICSVRNGDGTLWINCSERLCSTKKTMNDPEHPRRQIAMPLCEYQSNILLDIGRTIFGNDTPPNEILIRREISLKVSDETDYHADYIMSRLHEDNTRPGPNRLIIEMQGGGETSNTGTITRHLDRWRNEELDNTFLRQQVNASTLETNAWRRQQEQFIVKGNIAAQTWKGYGLAFCVGTLLFDYITKKINLDTLPDLHNHNWTLALIGIKEDTDAPIHPGAIPLKVDTERLLFTNYQTFVHALINQGQPSEDAFIGEYRSLTNNTVNIDYQ